MSTSSHDFIPRPKFTRGEKCIYAHLIITFVAILAIVIIYFAHVCLVRHPGGGEFKISRRSKPIEVEQIFSRRSGDGGMESYQCAGAVYVGNGSGAGGERAACGSALLAARWSLVPARCAAARALPDLAHLLPYWNLRYDTIDAQGVGVRRSVMHPGYDDDDLTSNVGLFEHEADVTAHHCLIPTEMLQEDLLNTNMNAINIVGWQAEGGRLVMPVRYMTSERCSQFVTPVVDRLRTDERCVASTNRQQLEYPLIGSVLFVSHRMVGISSWGDHRSRAFPIIVLDVAPYKIWLETTMSL